MPPPHEPITPLIRSAKTGQAEAFEKLLAIYRPRLLDKAARELPGDLKRKLGASDLVQDTLTAAYRGFERFRGETSAEFAVWLRKIYRNRLINLIKFYREAEKRKGEREGPVPIEEIPAPGTDPLQEMAEAEDRNRRIAALLDQLPEKARLVVRMKQFDHKSFEEIAAVTDQTVEAVRRMWSRAILKLKELKQKSENSDDSA